MRFSSKSFIAAGFVLVSAWASHVLAGGTVRGTVVIESMKPSAGPGYKVRTKNPVQPPDPPLAIVYLERDDGKYPKTASEQIRQIGQAGYQFRPGVSVVRTGTRVMFPNQDDEFHNVFSYSRAKRFDLGRFRKDEASPVITLDKPGLVKIYCEIHKHMRGLLLVLDTPWFTATDAQGHFELNNIPAGEYRLKAFLPSEATLESRVNLAEDKTITVNLAR